MKRLSDPVVADMQTEYLAAIRHGRVWRGRWVRFTGYAAFAKVLVMCEWPACADRGPLVRAVMCSLGAIPLVTAVFVAIPFYTSSGVQGFDMDRWQAVFFLLPGALVSSIPLGVTIGIAAGLARQRMSAHLTTLVAALAFVCSSGALVNLGWVVPASNQAFRVAAFRKVSPFPPPKGDNELTFPELNRRIRQSGTFPVDSYGRDEFTRLELAYHTRWAFGFATLVLALFTMSLLAWIRRRWVIGAGICVAVFGYYTLWYLGRSFALDHQLSPPAGAWLANAFFVVI